MIEYVGLNAAEFRWQDVLRKRQYQEFSLSRITHIPTGYWFEFTAGTNPFGGISLGGRYSPPSTNGEHYQGAENQVEQSAICMGWLKVVKQEHETVDLWSALKDESRLIIGEVVDEPNEKFTSAELDLLKLRLDDIKTYLLEHVPAATPAQIVYVNTTFNYVAESAERLTKKEWKAIFVSAIVTQVLALGLTPQVIHGVWSLAAHLILPLLGNLQLPPLPPTP